MKLERTSHIISVLVENRSGVLARVSALFSRRGYNIEGLSVGPTQDPEISRITIVVSVEGHALDQVIQQLVISRRRHIEELFNCALFGPRKLPPLTFET